jgi:hypothetical protein
MQPEHLILCTYKTQSLVYLQRFIESLIWPRQHHMTYNRFFYIVPTESVTTYLSYPLFIEVIVLFFQTLFYCFFHTIISLSNVASALRTSGNPQI